MIEVTFLIPTKDNDGAPFTPFDHDAFHDRLLTAFGGYSRHGLVYGGWRDPATGAVYHDETIRYVVGVENLLTEAAAVRTTAHFVCEHFRQLAVAVSYLGCLDCVSRE